MQLSESIDARGVAYLTLNRPHRRNALDGALVAALTSALGRLEADDGVRVVGLQGAGGNFCAGVDIEWIRDAAHFEENARALAGLLHTLYGLTKPTIATIEGAAFGGGVGLVAACDIAIAEPTATFSLSEVRLGLAPAVIAPFVVRAIGPRQARALFLAGGSIAADRAMHIGLLHEVAPEDACDAARERTIEALLLGAPGAQAQAKSLTELCLAPPLDQFLGVKTATVLAERLATAEAAEGLAAFLEKRAPAWRGSGCSKKS